MAVTISKEVLAIVRGALKERGINAKGTMFYKRVDGGNTIALSLQKSQKSSVAEVLVTVNYGVYSARIGATLRDDPAWAMDVLQAHWRDRLNEGGQEKWLRLSATEAADKVARTILDAIDGILPGLLAHSTDEALRAEWLSGRSPGIVNMQRLLFLSILLNEMGPTERLGEVVGELRTLVQGTVHESLVEGRLARAGVQVPR
jgi:hypothetical protein